MNSIIAVTMDDPAGIGPEAIIKSLSEAGPTGAPVVVVGCVRMLQRTMAMNITPRAELHVIQKVCDVYLIPGVINVMDEPLINPDALIPGVVQVAAGDLAYRCIERVTTLVLSGEMKATVITPLNREALHLGRHNYPGHTELPAHLTGSKRYATVLYTDELKVVHISAHISLCKFLDTLNGERVKTIIHAANHFLKCIGIKCLRIAVAGANPHVGEYGLSGTEKIEIIAPAVEAMQAEDIDVTDLRPSNTMFIQCYEGLFGMAVAMYCDQGHILLGLLGFYDGTNIATGLPFIYTSADHGTAFDITWTGKARSESVAVSIQLAMQILRE